ncbi:MAG TPA: LytR C-terminal domain-containing protein, partial [Actinomycetales bacterium]|nr:LytR C-terminal domain-containing protein [Actinomycetales bacterium]
MSARKDYPYPEDEFDVAASAGGPEGVHRAQRSTARKVAPWIVVLLIVPLISFGVVFWLSQNDTDVSDALFGDDEPSPTAPADDESPDDGADEAGADEDGADEAGADEDGAEEDGAAEDGAGEDGDDESGADEDGEEEALPVNREVTVDVLNATQISGLAAIASERLEADGFSAVTAGNFQG